MHRAILDDTERNNKDLVIVYSDLEKAFYAVPHQALTLSLEAVGITGNLLKLIKNRCLTNLSMHCDRTKE